MRVLKLNVDVRYYEDGCINGETDIPYEIQEKCTIMPRVPCVVKKTVKAYNIWKGEYYEKEDFRWCPEISIDEGKILNWGKGTLANLHYKVCDGCEFSYQVDGVEVLNYNDRDFSGYVPSFLSIGDDGYGDYIIMTILPDGSIKGWDVDDFDDWLEEAKEKLEKMKNE